MMLIGQEEHEATRHCGGLGPYLIAEAIGGDADWAGRLGLALVFGFINFGGHATGPRYLPVRGPLQLLVIFWTYWFVLRESR